MRAPNWLSVFRLFGTFHAPAKTSRRRPARLNAAAEVLECRLCLSGVPVIANLALQNDTGQAGDNITSDPTITGNITNVDPGGLIDVEFDLNGDGSADDWNYGGSDSFEYTPSNELGFGQVTIAVRAIVMYSAEAEFAYSEWTSITFSYENPNVPASIGSLSLANDTGTPGDNITQDPTVTGTILNDGPFDMIDVEIDYDGDGIADDWIYGSTDGTFEFSPTNHPGFGQLTFAVRVLEMDPATFEYTFSEWVAITFTFENPNEPASIASLSLANDTGTPGDNITEDPTITGTIQNDGPFDMIDVEIDYDGDGIADDWIYGSTDGTFEFNPGADFGFGQVTVAVRVLEMDPGTFEYTYSDWVSITFTFEE